jgi:hypothetical protein
VRSIIPLVLRRLLVAAAVVATVACGSSTDETPIASAAVTLTPSHAAGGSPIQVHYRLEAVAGATMPAGEHVVFVHWVDADGQQLWTDDHVPPVPLQQWRAGTPVEYDRTIFIPRVSVTGPVQVRVGIYAPATGERLPLAGEPVDSRAYPVATLDIRPDPSSVFVAFGEGWYNPETGGTLGREWRWSRGTGLLAFRNPKQPAELWLELDQPVKALAAPQQVTLRIAGAVVDTFTLPADTLTIHRTPLTVDMLGSEETVELEILPSESFVPASIPALKNTDRRTLGIRVFNAHLAVR